MTEDYLRALFDLDRNYKFYLQCCACFNWVLLEFDRNVKFCKGLNVKGWSLYSICEYRDHQLCYCRIAEMKKEAEKNRYEVKIKRQTLTMHNWRWNEIYNHGMKKYNSKEKLKKRVGIPQK